MIFVKDFLLTNHELLEYSLHLATHVIFFLFVSNSYNSVLCSRNLTQDLIVDFTCYNMSLLGAQ